MVARYSNKRAKYTYAERVLGALSEIQKDHRKHAVHMATLRAHVRKTADARKDKMGPQWAQWVSRTVTRLVDDGILDTADAHGNITFTPNAKKTITKVRRESMGPGVVPSPGLEHKIWKDITRRFSGAGVKRSRRRSSAVPAQAANDSNWDDGEDTRPRKRQARKSMSRKTKAELESELQDALERLHEAQELEPINAEELSVLQEELSDREKEVAALREELEHLKDQSPADDRRVTVGTSTSMVTPPPTNPSLPSSSGRTATSTRSRLAMHSVTRTLSGSLISNISKQPTPEPSDEGSQGSADDIDELIFDDTQDASMSASPEFERFPHPQLPLGLATPQSSPFLADQEDLESQEPLDGYEQGRDEPIEEVTLLKGELESQSAALNSLREEHKRLLSERDELRASVASRDDRIHALHADIHTRDEALASKELQRAGLEKTLAGEHAQRKQLEPRAKAFEAALSAEQERNAVLQANSSSLEARCDDLKGEVRYLNVHSRALAEELNSARIDASKWRTAHWESEAKLKKATEELANVNARLGSAQDQSHSLAQALDASTALLEERTAELEQTNTALSSAQSELAKARLALEAVRASQTTLSSRIAELERNLEDARERARALRVANTALERTSGSLQDTIKHLRGELSHAKSQFVSSREDLQQAQDVIDDLRVSHAQAQVDAADALAASKASVSELESTVDTLRSELQDAAATAAELHESLETEQVSRRLAESKVVSTQAHCDKLLSDLAGKTARLSSATETLAEVKRTESEMRRELNTLEELHASELAARTAERSGFEEALEIARTQGADLQAQVDRLNGRLSSVSEELASALAEKDVLSSEVREAREHTNALQEHLELAQDDIRDAELEIQDLRMAKAEDERSIQSLKAGLAKLRQLQMDALNEVDSKMISAHTAPTPGSRRRSSIAPRLSRV